MILWDGNSVTTNDQTGKHPITVDQNAHASSIEEFIPCQVQSTDTICSVRPGVRSRWVCDSIDRYMYTASPHNLYNMGNYGTRCLMGSTRSHSPFANISNQPRKCPALVATMPSKRVSKVCQRCASLSGRPNALSRPLLLPTPHMDSHSKKLQNSL